jgi:O-antigen biosynthesis protein
VGRDRTELLNAVVADLTARRWRPTIDSGWSGWDLEVCVSRYTAARVVTVQEEHGGGRRLIRVRYHVRARATLWLLAGLGAGLSVVVSAVNPPLGAGAAAATIAAVGSTWVRGVRVAGKVVRVIETAAAELKLVRCGTPT